ncbi:MAG TPA: DUF177 domain-containing protein [Thermoanaerobaculia bacterium]|jgi:uncharacterized protein|nr:DUF177 domain-containing protein [Thermoanaerobaculia bacterium]
MRIWLDQVREEPFNWDEKEKVAPEELDRPELLELGPVAWRGQVIFVDPGFFLRAHLSYEQTLHCNRCLQPIHDAVRSDVELMIEIERSGGGYGTHGGGEHELKDEDLGTMYVEGEVLETRPILIEQLQLNIPMKPLCQEDCKGLCPVCGTDRNTGSCTCEEKTEDPRWAALAVLKDRMPSPR